MSGHVGEEAMQLRLCWSLRAVFNLSCKRGRMQSWAAFSLQKTGRTTAGYLKPETGGICSARRGNRLGDGAKYTQKWNAGSSRRRQGHIRPMGLLCVLCHFWDGSLKSAVCSARNFCTNSPLMIPVSRGSFSKGWCTAATSVSIMGPRDPAESIRLGS